MPIDERSVRIRDPIHGTIRLSPAELALVDHPAFQRLRLIKQLGFAELAFPGATHSRYLHGLGTLHVASQMFESLTRDLHLADPDRSRLRAILRLSALFHDLGHAPLSHTTECFMPPVSALELGMWQIGSADRQASHEDYTLKILLDSSLRDAIKQRFGDLGISAETLACVLSGRAPTPALAASFQIDGRDWLTLLRQTVSSELDADRMDYLLRDSYFAGVPYGRYDHEWLIDHLVPVERDAQLCLGVDARAAFSFEDYLLSRLHMFLSVYLHHRSIAYELLLQAFQEEAPGEIGFPIDIEGYLRFDDVSLLGLLRASKNRWAKRVVERRAYRRLIEEKHSVRGLGQAKEPPIDLQLAAGLLKEAGIAYLEHTVRGRLSKYYSPSPSGRPPWATQTSATEEAELWVVAEGKTRRMSEYSELYRNHQDTVLLARVYVEPERFDEADQLLRRARI